MATPRGTPGVVPHTGSLTQTCTKCVGRTRLAAAEIKTIISTLEFRKWRDGGIQKLTWRTFLHLASEKKDSHREPTHLMVFQVSNTMGKGGLVILPPLHTGKQHKNVLRFSPHPLRSRN